MKSLSIVICKYNKALFEQCVASIKHTLNNHYELVVIDNTNNDYDIFEAYNKGVKRSTGDVICFIHEDVICHEQDWNKKVMKHFDNDIDLGMIGLAGGASYHKFAWSWNQTYYKEDYAVSLASIKEGKLSHNSTGFNSNTKQVLIVDGLWFCIKRELLISHQIRFDTNTYSGFHRYDYDISFQIAQISKIKVVNDIKIEHKSSGTRNRDWMQANIDFQKKWGYILPCKIQDGKIGLVPLKISPKDIRALYHFIYLMKEYGFTKCDMNFFIRRNLFKTAAMPIIQFKLILIYILGFRWFDKMKEKFPF
ncbi:glycosyltransferase [Winogradskyella sp. A3E31]|uniref:glycosyltransferase n=1 Tax=Winogradskyella sp. A3E31 TaxID=3349637 RepID=UPI00398A8D42